MLEKVTRPAPPPRIKGNSSFQYDKSTERDFVDIMGVAQETLLDITLKAIP